MILKERTLINLGSSFKKDLLGHISTYEKKNGNTYRVYFVEARYFGYKETDNYGRIVSEGRSGQDYNYLFDILLEREEKRMGWS